MLRHPAFSVYCTIGMHEYAEACATDSVPLAGVLTSRGLAHPTRTPISPGDTLVL